MKIEMTIEQQLEVIREALEKGAKVDITLFHVGKDDAEKFITHMSELTGASTKHYEQNDYYTLNMFETPLGCSVHYNLTKEEKKQKLVKELEYLEEDVDLSGGVDVLA